MKKLLTLLFLSTLTLASCSKDGPAGPQGPPGPQGPSGNGGDAQLSTIFEIESDFSYHDDSNLWSTDFISFEDFTNVEVFENDVVLIYRLDAVSQLDDGSDVDEWSLIPQNFFIEDGTIQYVFNHTFVDIEIFIDGNYDLSNLESGFTTDQIFRVVIIPAEFAQSTKVDLGNMKAVMNALDLKPGDIQKMHLKK